MAVKASELVALLNEHIEKYGDDKVMIYDDYSCCYKTIDSSQISRNNGRFVIECEEDQA